MRFFQLAQMKFSTATFPIKRAFQTNALTICCFMDNVQFQNYQKHYYTCHNKADISLHIQCIH